MKVALVHDYLNQRGGAERVFAHIAAAYPDAPIYTSLYDRTAVGDLIPEQRVRTSLLDRLPGSKRVFRYLAPLYPAAFERFDLSAFDTIVSSTTAWAKGVTVPPGAVHVCYINTVSRFVFAYDHYVERSVRGVARIAARPLVRALARWDVRAAQRPTVMVANSENVARRIRQYYRRDALVLHCPVDLDRFSVGPGRGDYFFIASRLLPYKRIDLAIEAANIARVPLVVAGTGPAFEELRRRARGTTTQLLGFISDERVNELMGNARAAILPGEEDYGLVPIEAAATGRPTIALRAGGALETIVEGSTGEFFDRPDPSSLAAALANFDERAFEPQRVRAHAERFAPDRFIEALRRIVEEARR